MDGAPMFVVAGSGRCGTGWIAAVLTAAGIRCGHEAWFNPLGAQAGGLAGDASWCAVPRLARWRGIVWHQTRHPLAVIASLAATPLWGPYAVLAEPYLAGVPDVPLAREVALWVALNEAAGRHASYRWQVEEVDVDLIINLGERIGLPVDPGAAKAAVVDTPTDLNAHGTHPPLDWADLPDVAVTAQAHTLAARYGYAA